MRRRWFALAAYLAVALCTTAAYSQPVPAEGQQPPVEEPEPEPVPDPTEDQYVPDREPAQAEQPPAEPEGRVSDPIDAAPTEIESGAAKEETNEESNELARRDLAAQESMAESTFKLLKVAWWQLAISAFGIIGLLFTIYYTRRAVKAATDSVTVTRDVGQSQVRCYPSIRNVEFGFRIIHTAGPESPNEPSSTNDISIVQPEISFEIRNFGQSPALAVFWRPSIKYRATVIVNNEAYGSERQSERNFPLRINDDNREWGDIIPARETLPISVSFGFDLNDFEKLALLRRPSEGFLEIALVVSLRYKDVFANVYTDDYGYLGATKGYSEGQKINMHSVSTTVFETKEEIWRRHNEKERAKKQDDTA